MTMFPDPTAAEFLSERRDFLYVYVVRSAGDPTGWDVVIRIDGTYSDRATAEGAAGCIRDRMDAITDARSRVHVSGQKRAPRQDGRIWWYGPPWKRPERSNP